MSDHTDISRSDIQQLIDQHDADTEFPEDLRIMADTADVDISDDLLHTTPASDVDADDTVSLTIDVVESGNHTTCDVDVSANVAYHILKVEAGAPAFSMETMQTLRQALGTGVSAGFIAYHLEADK